MPYDMDRKEYEEYYGEHVGTCKIHGTVLDGCAICDGGGDPEWLSECCSASPFRARGIDIDESTNPPAGFCGHCLDNCVFEDARFD